MTFIGVPEDHRDLHCVDFDFEQAGELLVDELVGLGNNHVHVLGWSYEIVKHDVNYIRRFSRGVRRAASNNGVSVEWSPAPADGAFAQVLDAGLDYDGRRTGILMTGAIAEGMGALMARGYQPGGNVDVVALGTNAETLDQAVPLTAVSLQPRDVSRRAARQVFGMIGNGPLETESLALVPADLTRRQSTRQAPPPQLGKTL